MMRLDKFLSQQLGASRSLVGRELRAGLVMVNGHIVKSGASKIELDDEITYQGQILQILQEKRYFMLNKPVGYVCSTDDPQHPTILYFMDEPMSDKLHAAGRLDLDTTGLVLLTDDGQWSHIVTSPKHHCQKTYLVQVDRPLSPDLIPLFAEGIQLRSEKRLTKPATLALLDSYTARLTISEGRYHQVKRMFAAVGHHVVGLHRERIGNIQLDNGLKSGEYRPLTEIEINSFYEKNE